jgi:tetratricopeptide (TPR) repeat protein
MSAERLKQGAQDPQHTPWLVLIAAGGLGLLVLCILGVGVALYPRGQNPSAGQGAPQQAQMSAPTETRRMFPSLIPSQTRAPRSTRTATLIPSQTLTLDPTQLYHRQALQITLARMALDGGHQSQQCIQAYDRLLEQMPEWEIGYYNRGVCKYQAAMASHDLGVFSDYLYADIADQNQVIALNPSFSEAYVELSFAYANLQESVNDNSADRKALMNISLENLRAGLALGSPNNDARMHVPLLLIDLDRCREAMSEANRQFAALKPGQAGALIYQVMARAHICLGEYASALPLLEKARAMQPTCSIFELQTTVLMGLGKTDEAFKVINSCIKRSPGFSGYRYYQRALIEYDRGQIDLARQDVDTGAGNTWYHGGLYAYLMGRLALDEGSRDEAVEWMQTAATTIQNFEGPWLMQRIRKDLAGLHASYTAPTASIDWEVTPIHPAPQAIQAPVSTPTP